LEDRLKQKNPRLYNGENLNGAENFDGAWVLRPHSLISLFIRQLTGKKQAFVGLSIGFGSHADIYALVLKIVAEISANSLRRETGKE